MCCFGWYDTSSVWMCREENHMHTHTTAGAALQPHRKSTPQFAPNNQDAGPFIRRKDVKHDRNTAWIEHGDSFHSCKPTLLSPFGWLESSWRVSGAGLDHITFAFNTVEMQLAGSPFMQKKQLGCVCSSFISVIKCYLVGARVTDPEQQQQEQTRPMSPNEAAPDPLRRPNSSRSASPRFPVTHTWSSAFTSSSSHPFSLFSSSDADASPSLHYIMEWSFC